MKLFVVAVVLSVFVLGGRGASQLWSCVVLFCGEWRRVSFRGAKGGESALELGVKLFVVVVVLSVFVLGGRGGQSASGAVKGEGGPVSFGVGCETVRRRRRRAVCFCFGAGGGASQLPGCEGGMI